MGCRMQHELRSEPGAGDCPDRARPVALPVPMPPPPINGSRALRALWLTAGLLFVLLAFIGALLPVMPTVPFLILAAACFSRSSRRFESWLLDHPNFGPSLREWRTRGAISRRGKFLALGGSTVGLTVLTVGVQPPWPATLTAVALIGAGMVYVFTRPS